MSDHLLKSQISKLHAIAEFQKKVAWANFEASKKVPWLKKELEAAAKQAADNCRETRETIRELIGMRDERRLQLRQGADENAWD